MTTTKTTVTPEEVRAVVSTGFESPLIPGLVLEALKKFEGKKITKRFATAVEKKLGEGYSVFYKAEDGYRYSISIWGRDIEYKSRWTFDLGHKPWNKSVEPEPFSVEKFTEDLSGRYYKYAAERNAKRHGSLTEEWCEATSVALTKVLAARAVLAEALAAAETLAKETPEHYALLALAEEK